MDILNQLIEKLNKEEVRNFKLLAGTSFPTDDRKDIWLFNYIRKSGGKFKEEKAIKKLYPADKDKNSYYRLKNRLLENLGNSLGFLHTHRNQFYELLQYIELYDICLSRNLFKASLLYLRKAERAAVAIENYEMLDIVYANFIRLSADLVEINPADYISKREKNAEILSNLRELDDILATVSYQLKITQTYGSSDKNLLKKLQAKVRDVSKHTTTGFSKNLESRIYSALSKIFLQQHNFAALEKLIKETYAKFEKANWFDKSNHELKLQMLTYRANALNRMRKHVESLKYAELLGEEIKAYNKLHYEKYLFFHYNTRVINYFELDMPKGLKVLNEFEQEMRRKENTFYDFFIYLNKAALLYYLGRYEEALKTLVRLYMHNSYAKADRSFKLKIEIAELIIIFESGDRENLSYRLGQVQKTFVSLQKEPRLKRDFEMIGLLESMNASPDFRNDKEIRKKITALLKEKLDITEEDSEILTYRRWLEVLLNRVKKSLEA